MWGGGEGGYSHAHIHLKLRHAHHEIKDRLPRLGSRGTGRGRGGGGIKGANVIWEIYLVEKHERTFESRKKIKKV